MHSLIVCVIVQAQFAADPTFYICMSAFRQMQAGGADTFLRESIVNCLPDSVEDKKVTEDPDPIKTLCENLNKLKTNSTLLDWVISQRVRPS